jgi:hypothetical protein
MEKYSFIINQNLILFCYSFRSSLFAIVLYGFFLHLRYYMSPFTRNIIHDVAMKIDGFVTTNPKVPPVALQYYTKLKNAFADKPPSAEKTDKKTQ